MSQPVKNSPSFKSGFQYPEKSLLSDSGRIVYARNNEWTTRVPISYKEKSPVEIFFPRGLGKASYDQRVGLLRKLDGPIVDFLDEVPNESAISMALTTGKQLKGLGILNAKVSASPEGGVMFEFFNLDETYFLIELYNDGDIVFLSRNKNGKRIAEDLNYLGLTDKLLELF